MRVVPHSKVGNISPFKYWKNNWVSFIKCTSITFSYIPRDVYVCYPIFVFDNVRLNGFGIRCWNNSNNNGAAIKLALYKSGLPIQIPYSNGVYQYAPSTLYRYFGEYPLGNVVHNNFNPPIYLARNRYYWVVVAVNENAELDAPTEAGYPILHGVLSVVGNNAPSGFAFNPILSYSGNYTNFPMNNFNNLNTTTAYNFMVRFRL